MSIASVITKPLNFNFFFKILVIIFLERVDGSLGVLSKEGTSICATITPERLLFINSLYGYNSILFILLEEKLMIGNVL